MQRACTGNIRRANKFRPAILLKLIIIIPGLVFIIINQLGHPAMALKDSVPRIVWQSLVMDEQDPRGVLLLAMPLLARSGAADDAPSAVTPRYAVTGALTAFQLRFSEPLDLLHSEISLLALATEQGPVSSAGASPPPAEEPEELEEAAGPPELSKHCLVAIYNTHTGETYALTDGMERLDGKRGGVVTVAAALQEELETRYGIRVARSDQICDAVYSTSYAESEKVARELLAQHPHLVTVLDIHRDAGKSRQNSLVTVNGREVAPILIVIGSDARASHPEWRQNYNFARGLSDKMDSMYPGLSLGVRVKEGRYNQYLHPGAILLEMGTVANSTGEAVASARLLAKVLAVYLAETGQVRD
ncbi:MAG: stage II sporulation protein P [Bacillota bacterium]